MFIRPSTPEDIPALIPLWKKMLDHHLTYHHNIYEYPGDDEESFVTCISEYIGKTDTQLFVSIEEQKITGYIQVRKMKRPAIFKHKQKGCIDGLFVDEAQRQKNIGKHLLAVALSWLNGVSYVELQVASGNEQARDFWTKNGFKQAGENFVMMRTEGKSETGQATATGGSKS